jgi:hypothetical protein
MPRSLRSLLCLTLCALQLAGCSSSVPRLHRPERVDAYCGDRAAIATAIESIVASTNDAPDGAVPSGSAILASVKDSGGIVAHWNDQPLYLPKIAKSLGLDGDYVTLGDAAIGNGPGDATTRTRSGDTDSRRIYLTLKTKSGPKTLALQAYDIQDVCNEGKLKS